MMMDLLTSVREWGPYALAVAFVAGVLLGNIVPSLKVRLWSAFAFIILPPLAGAALYWQASSSGCSSGECPNVLYGLIYIVAFAIFPICLGLGLLVGSMIAGVRRMIDAWVTPKAASATSAE